MKKAERIMLALVLIASIISFAYSYYKTVIRSDFDIVNTEPQATSTTE